MRLSLLTLLLLGCVVRHGAPIPAGTPSTQVDWVGLKDYPFESRFLAVDGGQMHYIDEGKGEPVVFVHGTPSWSYEWRGLISGLKADHRCIAMDHIGFGLSEKPAAWGYKPEDHARNLDALLTRLDLRDITLVVHDFGGPIGLSYALAHPERVKRVVVINSWLWSLSDNSQAQKADKLLRGPLGPLLYKDRNLSPRRLMPWALKGERPGALPNAREPRGALPDGPRPAGQQQLLRRPVGPARQAQRQAHAGGLGRGRSHLLGERHGPLARRLPRGHRGAPARGGPLAADHRPRGHLARPAGLPGAAPAARGP